MIKKESLIPANWNEIKGKIKQEFSILTDKDVMLIEGKQDELFSRLEKKLKKSKAELQEIISKFKTEKR